MHIQEVSQQLNLSKKAIMIYEQKGLIHPQKDVHGYRVYQQKDIERLMQIKCLRQLDFSISQIKDILINNQYDIFDLKKEEYEKQIFDIESHQLEQTKHLKKINSSTQTILPFERIIICLSIFIYALFLFDDNSFLSILASLAMLLILVIHFSSTFRLFLYEIYQKIKK